MKLSKIEKDKITNQCQPFIDKLKKEFIQKEPIKEFPYLVDIYVSWYKNYLYFCEKNKSEEPNRIADEFEMKFVRLEYAGIDNFHFSYMRHTGKWSLVTTSLSLNECLEMIESNPNFQPLG